MATKKTKTLEVVSTVPTVTTSQYIPLTDENGNLTKVSLANLKAALLGGINLDSANDGVFIMCHLKGDNYAYMYKLDKWPSLQNSGEIADGVVVVEGGKMLVVAPTETALTWSSADVSGGGTTTSERVTAFNDWNGKANTAAQIQHDECSSESYAPGFCAKYSRVNANGQGLTAGKWWLPSMGELMCIYANMRKINYALSLIEGATPLRETWYWSSTEGGASLAWRLGLFNGYAYPLDRKVTDQFRVRPVSAFIR